MAKGTIVWFMTGVLLAAGTLFAGSAAVAADAGRGENLIANADFSQPLAAPWSVVPGVERRETEALSGDWMLSALGKNYFIINYLDDPKLKWEADEMFTVVMDARSRGSGAKMYVIHRYDKPDGTLGEGTFRSVSLSDEWHEYYLPMRTTKGGKPRGFSFFKIDTGAHDTGIQIRSFKMYRGKISSLDMRPVGRAGRATVEKGTEIPVAPNLYGTAARPLRALVFVNNLATYREPLHLFAGTGATAHFVVAGSKGSDTFVTDNDPKEVLRALKAGEYDLYAIGRDTGANIGEEVFKLIDNNVKKGAAVYFSSSRTGNYGAFTNLVAAAQAGERYGQGRVTVAPFVKGLDDVWPNVHRSFVSVPVAISGRLGYEDFPYEDIVFAQYADRMWRAAFGAPDTTGTAVTRQETAYAGENHICEWTKTSEGKTVSFQYRAEPLATATIGKITDTDREIEVAVSNATATAALKWRFEDFSGRVFGEGEKKIPLSTSTSSLLSLSVPREKLYTSFGLLKLELTEGPRVLDRRNFPVIERDNDRLRMIGDYGVGFWPMKSQYMYGDAKDMFNQLKSAGFNYSFMPHAWGTVYPTGLAATSSYVIGGEYFSGDPKAKDNIRSPVFNTPEARKRIRAKALKWAEGNRRWGGMYGSFSDEAQLGPNGMEVDAHPENIKVYRQWMEKKYGTITEYNRRHRSNHASFADLGQTLLKDARAASNAAEFVEWRNFNVDRWVEVIREVGDAIKEVDPKVLYSLDNSFGEMALSGNDYWKLLSQTGLDYSKEYSCCTSFGREPLLEFDALYRSWRPDMRIWGWTGYGFTSDREKVLPWMTALHRHGGFHWFAATYDGINLLDLVTGAKTLDTVECERSLKETRMLTGLGKTLTDWEWAKNDIAIYYSHDSCILTYFLGTETLRSEIRPGTPYSHFQRSRRGAMSLLESTFYQYEFVSQEQVEKGFLDGGDWSVYRAGKVLKGQPPFKVLFLPHILAMSDREVAAVKAFLKRGGKAVCDVLPGAYDELGVPRATMPFSADEMTVLGKDFNDLDMDQRAWVVGYLKDAGATVTIESPTVVANLEREGMHYRNGGADLYAVVRKPYHSATVVEHDANVEDLRFAKPGHIYDVRALKYLGFGDRVKTVVPYAEAQLFAVLPAKIEGIAIEAKVKGEERWMTADFTIQTSQASQRLPAYVLHVDVVSPSGKCPVHFQRNLATKDGKAHLDFPLALNDETGEWKIRVTEPLTGVSAERTFAYRSFGYSYVADFSVADDVGEAYGIDIERISHYSHGHGKVVDGQYAILVNGNRHYLATPKLGDFSLEAVWNIQTTHAGGPGYGLVVRFRRDRASGIDHVLELFRERKTSVLSITLDGRELERRENDTTDFTQDQTLKLVVEGRKGCVTVCGLDVAFDLSKDLGKGYVALDAASDSQQQLYFRSVRLTSPETLIRKEFAHYRLSLDKTQGFAQPVDYDVTLSRYDSGETLLEAVLSGTIRSRPLEGRVQTGGWEWGSVLERLDTPYVRILDADGKTFAKCNFWNGEKTLKDTAIDDFWRSKGRTIPQAEPWPKHFSKTFVAFPKEYSIAGGYKHAIANPWRYAEEQARERVVDKDGRCLYDGTPLLGGAVCVKAESPADKRLVSKIPADIPQRAAALKHAREQHYFYESEKVRFLLKTYFNDAEWEPSEVAVVPRFTDVYGDAVTPRVKSVDKGGVLMPGGIRRLDREVSLDGNLACGVYKLQWTVSTGLGKGRNESVVFEVLPDDPNGPCPPLASGLPQFVSMPNEVKYLEQNAIDPWGDVGGVAHYFSVDNRYPLVGNGLEIWRLLPIYRRQWWCWNWTRNSDRLDIYSDFNKDLIRHADVYDGNLECPQRQGRYEFGVVSFYQNYQLELLRQFVKEKGLEDKVPVPEPYTCEALKVLFDTCWRDWVAWARPRVVAKEREFTDYVLSVNPKVGLASYGPYAFYVTHYKTAYQLDYAGYTMQKDRRLRNNGSFWLFEEYHHSCDYPLFRPALFVATYDLHYGDVSRRIFPEIYYSGWGRCEDGAVYMAHPMSSTYLADCHQRRIAYQYAYGTPQLKDGAYRFWKDYGFHARNPEVGAMEEFVHAWGNLVKNRPSRPLKAPVLVHDLEALRRNGEYFDDECNPLFRTARDSWMPFSDVGNSAEDDLAYGFEQAVVRGYTTPVATTFRDLKNLDRANAEFVILPPIVEGTPKDVLDGIRALHARGVGLIAFEQVAGLEDLFGVRRAADRPVGYVKGESFSHKLAKARYAADGAETILFAAEKSGAAEDIPLVLRQTTPTGRTAFVNAPASMIRRASFRTVYHWGQDSLSEPLKAAVGEAYAFLAPKPDVKSEHGLVSSATTENGDVVVIVSDEPPIYKDRTTYPVPFRFTVRVPGIGDRRIEADTDFSVVSKERDSVTVRAAMTRDNAYFFRFVR